MKFSFHSIIFLVIIFFVTSNFAICPRQDVVELPTVPSMSNLNVQMCVNQLRSKTCRDVYSKIKSNGEDVEERVLRCVDEKPMLVADTEIVKGCAQGGWNFLKNLIVPLGTSIGEGVAKIVISREEFERWNNKCSQSKEEKRAIYLDYNNSVPALMRVQPIDDKKLTMLSCELIKNDLDQKRMKLQPNLDRLRTLSLNKANSFQGQEKEYVEFIRRADIAYGMKTKTTILEDARKLLKEKGVELDCYNPEYKTALLCEAVADVVTMIVAPAAAALKSSKIKYIAGLSKPERMIISTTKEFEIASGLSMDERIQQAEKLLGKKLTPKQVEAIEEAHRVGEAEGRGFGTYTRLDIERKVKALMRREKTEVVDKDGNRKLVFGDPIFSRKEAELLLDRGIAGSLAPVNHAERVAGERTLAEFAKNGQALDLEKGLGQLKSFYRTIMRDPIDSKKFFSLDNKGVNHLLDANEGGVEVTEITKFFRSMFSKEKEGDLLINLKEFGTITSQRIKDYEMMYAKNPNDLLKYKIYKQKELRARIAEEYMATKYPEFVGLDGLVKLDKIDPREAKIIADLRKKIIEERRAAEYEMFPTVDKGKPIPIFTEDELARRQAMKQGTLKKLEEEKVRKAEEEKIAKLRDKTQREARAAERKVLQGSSENPMLASQPNHSLRVLGEKYLTEFAITGDRKMFEFGVRDARRFYRDVAKDEKAAISYFSTDSKGMSHLVQAAGNGFNPSEAADIFKKVLSLSKEDKIEKYKDALKASEAAISDYQGMLKTTTDPSRRQLLEFKIFQTKSLRGELLEDYYGAKYPSKYGDRVDLDRMSDADIDFRHAVSSDIELERTKMEKMGLLIK